MRTAKQGGGKVNEHSVLSYAPMYGERKTEPSNIIENLEFCMLPTPIKVFMASMTISTELHKNISIDKRKFPASFTHINEYLKCYYL